MQEESGEIVKKVTKKSNSKMSKSQKAPNPNSLQQQSFSNSPQNVRLDTSESDEESVSEVINASTRLHWANFAQLFICFKVKIFTLIGHLCECYFVSVCYKDIKSRQFFPSLSHSG
jgi:hypothetical protein